LHDALLRRLRVVPGALDLAQNAIPAFGTDAAINRHRIRQEFPAHPALAARPELLAAENAIGDFVDQLRVPACTRLDRTRGCFFPFLDVFCSGAITVELVGRVGDEPLLQPLRTLAIKDLSLSTA
jgi:hypothetical protein